MPDTSQCSVCLLVITFYLFVYYDCKHANIFRGDWIFSLTKN